MTNAKAQGFQTKHITLVDLPSDRSKQESFLKQLQAALAESGVLNVLPMVVGTESNHDQSFYIPTNVEADLRQALKLGWSVSDDALWVKWLEKWGAHHVQPLDQNSYFSLIAYRETKNETTASELTFAKLSVTEEDAGSAKGSRFSVLPKDFRTTDDWHMGPKGVNVFEAWKLFNQSKTLPWKDIRVGHIDTGYTMHTALGWMHGSSTHVLIEVGQDLWRNGDRWQWGKNPGVWHDPYDDGSGSFPGHGSRISAMIAGYLEGAAFAGVAPGVCIVPYRVTDSVIVDHVKDLIATAIHDAIDKQCKVINISLGAMFPSSNLAAALDKAYESGVIVCCAAGQVWGEVIYPGRYNRCITMGGVGLKKGELRPWASAARGPCVDLCAPADGIRRVKAPQPPRSNLGADVYAKADGDGTSYATAMCSGVAAMWLAHHGADLLKTYKEPWQIPAAFKKLARETAKPHQFNNMNENGETLYGSGVLNAEALLKKPLPKAGLLHKANLAEGQFDPKD